MGDVTEKIWQKWTHVFVKAMSYLESLNPMYGTFLATHLSLMLYFARSFGVIGTCITKEIKH